MGATAWPTDVCPVEQEWGIQDNAVLQSSPLTGAGKTYERPGSNRWVASMDFRNVRDEIADIVYKRRALRNFVVATRGRNGRIWAPDLTTSFMGSFPALELVTNGDFSAGGDGWTVGPDAQLIAEANSVRLARTQTTGWNSAWMSQTVPTVVGNVYVGRCLFGLGRGPQRSGVYLQDSVGGRGDFRIYSDMTEVALVAHDTTMSILADTSNNFTGIGNQGMPGYSFFGDYIRVLYMSLARGAMVDTGLNSLLWSDDISNAVWTKVACTVSAGTILSYDGSASAHPIVEDAATTQRYIAQTWTSVAAVEEEYIAAIVRPSARNWFYLQIAVPTTSDGITVWFNLSAGQVGTQSIGVGFSGCSPYMQALGGGYYLFGYRTKRTDASKSVINHVLGPTTADNTFNYAGGGSSVIAGFVARMMGGPSSGAIQWGGATNAAALTAATLPGVSGNILNIVGCPPSIQQLGRAGDRLTVNGEYKELVEDLHSDALGRGIICFEPTMRRLCPDQAAVNFLNPLCRMRFTDDTVKWATRKGAANNVFDSDLTLGMIEAFG